MKSIGGLEVEMGGMKGVMVGVAGLSKVRVRKIESCV